MYLYGASGHAKVIIDILESNGIIIKGIFDDDESKKSLLSYPVINKFDLSSVSDDEIIISIGDNNDRMKVSRKLSCKIGKAIHNSAIISKFSTIGDGTVVMHRAIIQSNAEIGKHVIINSGAIVEHDCIVEDFVHISPNSTLCGNVSIGLGSHLGAGAVVIPGIQIGNWSIIGAGTVVITDIPDNVVVVGNPGRIIKSLNYGS